MAAIDLVSEGVGMRRGVLSFLAVVLLGVLLAGCRGGGPGAGVSGWKRLDGMRLSSVAWSADGKQIAFVATPSTADEDGYVVPKWAEIWLFDVGKERLRRLGRVTAQREGIPTSLFWLSGERLGWSSSGLTGAGFGLYSLSTTHPEVGRLCGCNFRLRQSRSVGRYAPDDVYYDAPSHTLLMSGHLYGGEVNKASTRVVYVYDTDTRSLDLLPLQADVSNEICESSEDDGCVCCGDSQGNVWDDVGACGRVETKKPELFVSGGLRDKGVAIWQSGSWAFSRDRVIVRSDGFILFPRTSPDSRWLAWIGYVPGKRDDPFTGLYLYDLKAKSKRLLTYIPDDWSADDPGMGCPFAWSPKGDRVAFADGSRIRFVEVRR